MKNVKISMIILFILGVLLFNLGYKMMDYYYIRTKSFIITKAQYESYSTKKEYDVENGWSAHYIIKYEYKVNDKTYYVSKSSSRLPSENETIDIKYNANNPADVVAITFPFVIVILFVSLALITYPIMKIINKDKISFMICSIICIICSLLNYYIMACIYNDYNFITLLSNSIFTYLSILFVIVGLYLLYKGITSSNIVEIQEKNIINENQTNEGNTKSYVLLRIIVYIFIALILLKAFL